MGTLDPPFFILYLDRYHLDDLLFVQQLAGAWRQAGTQAPPIVLLHGSGEGVERLLEAEGYFLTRSEGLLQPDIPEEARLLARGLREANRKLVNMLTDAGVHAVGFQGSDRNLLIRTEEEGLTAGRVEWLTALVRQHVVAVLTASIRGPEGVREVPMPQAATALAKAMGGAGTVVFLTRGATLEVEGSGPVGLSALSDTWVPAGVGAVAAVAEAGVSVLLTDLAGLIRADGPQGAVVVT